jgi:hypothetical protein
MGQIVNFGVLVGLRGAEIVESVRLINDKEAFPKYYSYETMTLSHYKFKQFLRTTKKAFLSFATPEVLAIVQNMDNVPSYNAIRLACRKRGITCDIRFARKIHGSWLHQHGGITAEDVDFLQGMIKALQCLAAII